MTIKLLSLGLVTRTTLCLEKESAYECLRDNQVNAYFLFRYTMLKIRQITANMMPRLDKVLKTMVIGRKKVVSIC